MSGQIGPYRVEREIGRGGMGVVHLAHDTRLDRPVAIKALPAELAQDPGRLERFEREARTRAAGIEAAHDAGIINSTSVFFLQAENNSELRLIKLDNAPTD